MQMLRRYWTLVAIHMYIRAHAQKYIVRDHTCVWRSGSLGSSCPQQSVWPCTWARRRQRGRESRLRAGTRVDSRATWTLWWCRKEARACTRPAAGRGSGAASPSWSPLLPGNLLAPLCHLSVSWPPPDTPIHFLNNCAARRIWYLAIQYAFRLQGSLLVL